MVLNTPAEGERSFFAGTYWIYIGAPKLTFMFLTASKSHEFYLFIYGFICLDDVFFINSQKKLIYMSYA